MKHLLLFIALIAAFDSFSQQFTIQGDHLIYDLPGPTFILASTSGSYCYVSEMDENEVVVWKDSLEFNPHDDSIYVSGITAMGSTGDFMINFQRVISPYGSTPFAFTETWDVLFCKVSLNNQEIVNSVIDQYYTLGRLRSAPYGAESVALLDIDVVACPNGIGFASNSFVMDTSLTITNIATNLLSCTSFVGPHMIETNDTLSLVYAAPSSIDLYGFDTNWNLANFETATPNDPTMGQSTQSTRVWSWYPDEDSLRMFSLWEDASEVYWQFELFDKQLVTNNSFTNLAPALGADVYVAKGAMVTEDRIYVLGFVDQDFGAETWTLFEYDYTMNELCRIDISFPFSQVPQVYKYLTTLNDKLYIVSVSATGNFYTRIGCELASISETEMDFVKIQPNPAINQFTISGLDELEVLNISLVSTSGVWIKDLNVFEATQDISDVTSGVYLVQINAEGGSFIKRIVIQ